MLTNETIKGLEENIGKYIFDGGVRKAFST